MLLRTIAMAGAATAGGFFAAQQLDKFLSKPGTKFDDEWKPATKELVRNGVAAGVGVGLFAVLRSF